MFVLLSANKSVGILTELGSRLKMKGESCPVGFETWVRIQFIVQFVSEFVALFFFNSLLTLLFYFRILLVMLPCPCEKRDLELHSVRHQP